MNNFLTFINFFIPRDSITKKRKNKKRNQTDIGGAETANTEKFYRSSKKTKISITDIELRYHKNKKYYILNKFQKSKLYE